MKILQDQVAPPERCVYLPEHRAQLHYRAIENCSAEYYQGLLEHGWRRFGSVFFRPVCKGCQECRSLRIPVAELTPSRSMRRTEKRNRDLRVVLRRPSISRAHLELYDRYHADMAERRDWREKSTIDPFDYHYTFVEGAGDYGHELLYFEGERMIAVALVDLLPRAVSAVYCYYDPEERQRGLGVFSVLRQIALARQREVPYVYLGYWIEPNASMRYKSRYRPHQLLVGRPELETEPPWRPVE